MEHVHRISVSGHAQSSGDHINIQRDLCLCTLFLALFHCVGDGVGGDLSTGWGERLGTRCSLPS